MKSSACRAGQQQSAWPSRSDLQRQTKSESPKTRCTLSQELFFPTSLSHCIFTEGRTGLRAGVRAGGRKGGESFPGLNTYLCFYSVSNLHMAVIKYILRPVKPLMPSGWQLQSEMFPRDSFLLMPQQCWYHNFQTNFSCANALFHRRNGLHEYLLASSVSAVKKGRK